jgi:hypothetical protein
VFDRRARACAFRRTCSEAGSLLSSARRRTGDGRRAIQRTEPLAQCRGARLPESGISEVFKMSIRFCVLWLCLTAAAAPVPRVAPVGKRVRFFPVAGRPGTAGGNRLDTGAGGDSGAAGLGFDQELSGLRTVRGGHKAGCRTAFFRRGKTGWGDAGDADIVNSRRVVPLYAGWHNAYANARVSVLRRRDRAVRDEVESRGVQERHGG